MTLKNCLVNYQSQVYENKDFFSLINIYTHLIVFSWERRWKSIPYYGQRYSQLEKGDEREKEGETDLLTVF